MAMRVSPAYNSQSQLLSFTTPVAASLQHPTESSKRKNFLMQQASFPATVCMSTLGGVIRPSWPPKTPIMTPVFPSNYKSKRSQEYSCFTTRTMTMRKWKASSAEQQESMSMAPEKAEIFRSLEGWAEENMLTLLKPVEESWQPADFLPDPSSSSSPDSFVEKVAELRERAREIPDEYYVCLVGDMVTEEALPTYQTVLNTFDGGVRDDTGASPTPWARWTRAWTAEENRHGDLLNRYLYLSGRVDMRQADKTIHYLIAAGMDLRVEKNPYMGFVYTSFQERATFISHSNTARHAKRYGDATLAIICGTIAADEKRHERAYVRVVEKLFEVDPDATMRAFAAMMRRRITMPAALMSDGRDPDLFRHYAAVAQRAGVYTARDYADIVEFLVRRWRVADVAARLSGEGREAQDYLCNLAARIRRVEEKRVHLAQSSSHLPVPFSWIFNRHV